MAVSNPVGYLGAVDKLMRNEVMKGLPGGFDIWQIVAGGPRVPLILWFLRIIVSQKA